jgi:hypothetical protein
MTSSHFQPFSKKEKCVGIFLTLFFCTIVGFFVGWSYSMLSNCSEFDMQDYVNQQMILQNCTQPPTTLTCQTLERHFLNEGSDLFLWGCFYYVGEGMLIGFCSACIFVILLLSSVYFHHIVKFIIFVYNSICSCLQRGKLFCKKGCVFCLTYTLAWFQSTSPQTLSSPSSSSSSSSSPSHYIAILDEDERNRTIAQQNIYFAQQNTYSPPSPPHFSSSSPSLPLPLPPPPLPSFFTDEAMPSPLSLSPPFGPQINVQNNDTTHSTHNTTHNTDITITQGVDITSRAPAVIDPSLMYLRTPLPPAIRLHVPMAYLIHDSLLTDDAEDVSPVFSSTPIIPMQGSKM